MKCLVRAFATTLFLSAVLFQLDARAEANASDCGTRLQELDEQILSQLNREHGSQESTEILKNLAFQLYLPHFQALGRGEYNLCLIGLAAFYRGGNPDQRMLIHDMMSYLDGVYSDPYLSRREIRIKDAAINFGLVAGSAYGLIHGGRAGVSRFNRWRAQRRATSQTMSDADFARQLNAIMQAPAAQSVPTAISPLASAQGVTAEVSASSGRIARLFRRLGENPGATSLALGTIAGAYPIAVPYAIDRMEGELWLAGEILRSTQGQMMCDLMADVRALEERAAQGEFPSQTDFNRVESEFQFFYLSPGATEPNESRTAFLRRYDLRSGPHSQALQARIQAQNQCEQVNFEQIRNALVRLRPLVAPEEPAANESETTPNPEAAPEPN